MRLPFVLAAAFLLGAALPATSAAETQRPTASQHHPLDAMAAAKRSKKRASGAYGRGGTQIACTPAGCHPIPRGCRVRPGMNPFTWNPTGFDEIVCPYYR
jgi:hypothetical protein